MTRFTDAVLNDISKQILEVGIHSLLADWRNAITREADNLPVANVGKVNDAQSSTATDSGLLLTPKSP
jgi:hypothetical protein